MGNGKLAENGMVSKLTQLFALFVIYVFLSGWTFFDYYYRFFQIDPRWLDLPLQEVLVKGFTILFTSGYWLWLLYLLMIFVSVLFEEGELVQRRTRARTFLIVILCAVLIGVYFASRYAGLAEAKRDKGAESQLPLVTFSLKADPAPGPAGPRPKYTGHILAFRNGIYYLHDVSPLNEQEHSLALRVVRLEDLTDVEITEQ
jgi:hypothetical protein